MDSKPRRIAVAARAAPPGRAHKPGSAPSARLAHCVSFVGRAQAGLHLAGALLADRTLRHRALQAQALDGAGEARDLSQNTQGSHKRQDMPTFSVGSGAF